MSFGTPSAPVHKSLSEMLHGYLETRANASAAGLAAVPATGEVYPFETASTPPVDPAIAWKGAGFAGTYFDVAKNADYGQVPPDWPRLVATHEPVLALPMCLGNFPQMVRDLHGLVNVRPLASLRPVASRPTDVGVLESATEAAMRTEKFARCLMLIGLLRLSKQFDLVERFLAPQDSAWPENCHAAVANERAALAWHRGNFSDAREHWDIQEQSVPVLFNRGMAALFSESTAEAKRWLVQAVEQVDENSAWHHLGRLYLALASLRG